MMPKVHTASRIQSNQPKQPLFFTLTSVQTCTFTSVLLHFGQIIIFFLSSLLLDGDSPGTVSRYVDDVFFGFFYCDHLGAIEIANLVG
jgi:hypothetical protein